MWWDCAPLAAAECHAARIPLVVPRLGGLPETVIRRSRRPRVRRPRCRRPRPPARSAGAGARAAGTAAGRDRRAPRSSNDYIDDLEAYYAGARPGRVTDEPAHGRGALAGRSRPAHEPVDHQRPRNRTPAGSGPAGQAGPRALDRPLPHAADVEVRHQWPPDLSPPPAGRLAVIQPWEFGAVPRDSSTQIVANVDELWVPSALRPRHVRRRRSRRLSGW